MTDEILKRLDALGAKLGVAAQHLYGVYVQQARVEGISDIGAGLVFLLMSLGGLLLLRTGIKEAVGDMAVCGGILMTVFIVLSICMFGMSIGELVNPEFWAIHQLSKDIFGAK